MSSGPNRVRSVKARRGTNEVMAEFVLIIVSIIASVMVAGFLFGTLAAAGSPAEVMAHSATCSAVDGSEVCSVTLTNIGARAVGTDGICTLTVGGSVQAGQLSNGGIVPASGSLSDVGCRVDDSTVSSGSQVLGTVSLTNGAQIPFVASSS
jgi:hypothetical protein